MHKPMIVVLCSLAFCCTSVAQINDAIARNLARLPLHCINKEYPNKVNHTADTEADARLLPHELHPAFYGCLDWHSSVHGHWLLVKVLKEKYINKLSKEASAGLTDSIITVLNNSFEPARIQAEAEYFTKYKTSKTFERTYGWAWLLKLDEELKTWNDPLARKWYEALQPLTRVVVTTWKEFLPKQTYPNRTGVHPNTAFGLVFALDWARELKDTVFAKAIIGKAKEFYLSNKNYPAYIEPDGTDFLSPSLEAADLLSRILPRPQFVSWLNAYFDARGIQRITQMPLVSDRMDMQIVHLDGLSLSRAWCLKGISQRLPRAHPWKKLFDTTADRFLKETLPKVASGNYGGDHWLASFALYALSIDSKTAK